MRNSACRRSRRHQRLRSQGTPRHLHQKRGEDFVKRLRNEHTLADMLRTSGPDGGSHEVFLAYADEDLAFVEKLARAMRRRGFEVWCAPLRLQAGHEWHDEIGRALARCEWFFLVLSPAATRSTWVKRELTYALDKNRRITPILCKRCVPERLSWTLPALQSISFVERPFRDALDELLSPATASPLPRRSSVRSRTTLRVGEVSGIGTPRPASCDCTGPGAGPAAVHGWRAPKRAGR